MTTKNLIYKVAKFNKDISGKTLQDLLSAAIKKKKSALSRRQPGDEKNQFRLINYNGTYQGMRVGEFFDYTHGYSQPTATFKDDVEELEITTLKPTGDQDFLHSILYFGVFGNSVILSQSMTLRSKQFEDYLNWLLAETAQIAEDDFVMLCDNPPLSAKKKIVNTKSIELKAPVDFTPVSASEKTKTVLFSPSNVGWEWLKAILPPEMTLPTELKASEVLNNSQLDVKLLVSWRRQAKDDSTALLDRISNQLRHVDTELDYTINTASGKIERDEIKLKKPVSVNVNDKGLVVKSDMWEKMREWMTMLINDEKIIPKS